MSTISVVIVAFYLDLSIDLSCAVPTLNFSELGESIGRGENLIADLPFRVLSDYMASADRCKWYNYPTLYFSSIIGLIFSCIENTILEANHSIFPVRH
jgi:hypothetical protein